MWKDDAGAGEVGDAGVSDVSSSRGLDPVGEAVGEEDGAVPSGGRAVAPGGKEMRGGAEEPEVPEQAANSRRKAHEERR